MDRETAKDCELCSLEEQASLIRSLEQIIIQDDVESLRNIHNKHDLRNFIGRGFCCYEHLKCLLFYVCDNTAPECLRYLLHQDLVISSITKQDNCGRTPLMVAVEKYPDVARTILEYWAANHETCRKSRNMDALQTLCGFGAPKNWTLSRNFAADVAMLIDAGVNPNSFVKFGFEQRKNALGALCANLLRNCAGDTDIKIPDDTDEKIITNRENTFSDFVDNALKAVATLATYCNTTTLADCFNYIPDAMNYCRPETVIAIDYKRLAKFMDSMLQVLFHHGANRCLPKSLSVHFMLRRMGVDNFGKTNTVLVLFRHLVQQGAKIKETLSIRHLSRLMLGRDVGRHSRASHPSEWTLYYKFLDVYLANTSLQEGQRNLLVLMDKLPKQVFWRTPEERRIFVDDLDQRFVKHINHWSLMSLSREVVVSCVGRQCTCQVDKLPIPRYLKQYCAALGKFLNHQLCPLNDIQQL